MSNELCEGFRALLPEYWSGAISVNQHKEVEQHLAGCKECGEESEYLKRLWINLDLITADPPSPALRARFYESLDAYRRGAEEANGAPGKVNRKWWSNGWWSRPAFQFAAAAAMLAMGVFAGRTIDVRKDTSQVGELRGEVDRMRQLVALSLLQQQSATDRLQGVSWAYRVEKSDTEVVSALLKTVREDENVNVRLAAVDALRPFAKSSPLVRKALVQSLFKQDSSMAEIAVIDLLVELRERTATPQLRVLAHDPKQTSEVRERALNAAGELE